MTTKGPGGKIPSKGNPPQAKGVGRNAKRHDLERPTGPPPQSGSDLQQGDTATLQNGQRVAPSQSQPAAIPTQASSSAGRTLPATAEGQPDIMNVVGDRLGGTISQQTNAPARPTDQKLKKRGESWLNFLQQLSSQPGASPLLRASVQSQLARQIRDNSQQTRGGAIFMRDADDALEAL